MASWWSWLALIGGALMVILSRVGARDTLAFWKLEADNEPLARLGYIAVGLVLSAIGLRALLGF